MFISNQPINYNRNTNQPTFQSRNRRISEIKDISRIARREFPMFSNTILETKNSLNGKTLNQVYNYVSGLISEIRGYSSNSKTSAIYMLKNLDAIKKIKVGNCAESADVTTVACRINGFLTANSYELCAFNTKNKRVRKLGHTLTGIDFEKSELLEPSNTTVDIYLSGNKGIAVDNWAGVVDYEHNIRYKHHPLFEDKLKEDEIICFIQHTETKQLTEKDINYMRHRYPELRRVKSRVRVLLNDGDYKFEPMADITEDYRRNCRLKRALSDEDFLRFVNLRNPDTA